MANDDKTEKATPKRREEARKKGQVAKSADLNGAVVLAAGLFAITVLGPDGSSAARQRRCATTFAQIAHPGERHDGRRAARAAAHRRLHTLLRRRSAPIAGVCMAAGVLANVAQVGFKPSMTALKPDFKRINPVAGAKNLFGTRICFETGKALAKVAVVGAVAAMALSRSSRTSARASERPPGALGAV